MHCGRGLTVRGRDHQLWAWPSCKARGPRRELIGCGSKGAGLWQKGAGSGAEAGSRGSCGGAQGSFKSPGGQKQGVRSSHGADLRNCGADVGPVGQLCPGFLQLDPELPHIYPRTPPPPIFPYRNPWASQALPGAEPPNPPPPPPHFWAF